MNKLTILSILLASLAGCNSIKKEGKVQQKNNTLQIEIPSTSIKSTNENSLDLTQASNNVESIYIKLNKTNNGNDYIAKLGNLSWSYVKENGNLESKFSRPTLKTRPYLQFKFKINSRGDYTYSMLPLSDAINIEQTTNSAGTLDITLKTDGKVINEIGDIYLMQCPLIEKPQRSDCLEAISGEARIFSANGDLSTSKLIVTQKYIGETFWNLFSRYSRYVDKGNRRMADISGSNQIELEHEYLKREVVYISKASEREEEKNKRKATEEENRKKEEENRKIKAQRMEQERIKFITKSPIGTQLFCNSGDILLMPHEDLTSIKFHCTINEKSESIWLNELLRFGWDIASENRAPSETQLGKIGYIVSLRLKRINAK